MRKDLVLLDDILQMMILPISDYPVITYDSLDEFSRVVSPRVARHIFKSYELKVKLHKMMQRRESNVKSD